MSSDNKKFKIKSSGWVQYDGNTCRLIIDPNIVKYYRTLFPKTINLNGSKFSPHITIVREWERPNNNFVNKWYDGYYFDFEYSSSINFDGTYFYLQCISKYIKMMREEFDLIPYRKDKCFHITLGHIKE